MHDPAPTHNDKRSHDERIVAEGIQRVVIRLACAAFGIIAGTFAVIAAALASKDQIAFLAVGVVVIGASLLVIRTELRRKRELDRR